MAQVKITELTALTDPSSSDVLPIVDVGADATKKVTIADLLENAGDGSVTNAGFAFDGDPNTGMYHPSNDVLGFTAGGTQALRIESTGVIVPGNLTVEGTTTTIETNNLVVEDKNIQLATVTTPSNTTADGGGITLKGATDKTITWVNSTGCWTFNQPMNFNNHVRIDSSGNVGIGATDTLGNKVFIDGGNVRIDGAPSTDAVLQIRGDNSTSSSTDAVLSFVSYANNQSGGSNGDIRVTNAGSGFGQMAFATRRGGGANTEAMRIDSAGRLGLGTSSPSTYNANLAVYSAGGAFTGVLHSNTSGSFSKTSAISLGSDAVSYTYTTNGTTVALTGSAHIAAIQSASSGAPTDLAFLTTASGSVSEKMRIDSAGNVGIGTASPDRFVHIHKGSAGAAVSDSNTALMIENNTHAIIQMASPNNYSSRILFGDPQDADAGKFLYDHSNDSLQFYVNASERMRIDNSGNVGVGLSSPEVKLHTKESVLVSNTTSGDGNGRIQIRSGGNAVDTSTHQIRCGGGSGQSLIIENQTNSAGELILASNHASGTINFKTNSAERLRIDSSGNVGIGGAPGSERLLVRQSAVANAPARSAALYLENNANCEIQFVGNSSNDCQLRFGTSSNSFKGALEYELDNDNLKAYVDGSERLRINSSGNVGIGETAVGAGLDVKRDVNPVLAIDRGTANTANFNLQYNGTLTGQLGAASNLFQISAAGASTPMAFYANGAERMRIDTSGNVKIVSEHLRFNTSGKGIIFGTDGNSNRPSIIGNYTSSSDNNIVFNVTGSERMRINSSGNVGIGETSPDTRLHVKYSPNNSADLGSNTAATMLVENTSTNGIANIKLANGLNADGHAIVYGTTTSGSLRIMNQSAERMRIDSSGNVGVGTTSPAGVLHCDAASGVDGPVFDSGGSGNSNHALLVRDSANNQLLRVNNDGKTGIGTTSPAEKLQVNGNLMVGDDQTAGSFVDIIGAGANQDFGIRFGSESNRDAKASILTDTTNIDLRFDVNSAERMRITSAGNVGIGTTSPSNPLVVKESNNICIDLLKSTDASILTIGEDGSSGALFNAPIGDLVFQEGGSEVMRIDSSGRLLLGTTTEGEANADNLTIADSGNCGITIRSGTSSAGNIFFSDGTSGSDEVRGSVEYNHASNFLKFNTNATERLRIDSSGRLLVQSTSAPTQGVYSQYAPLTVQGYIGSTTGNGILNVARGTTAANLSSGSDIGTVVFSDSAGGEFGRISCFADATPGSNDYPGRISLHTTSDNASSPTERMRIDSLARITLGSQTDPSFVTEPPVTNYFTSATPTTTDNGSTGTWAANASIAPNGTKTASKFTASSTPAFSRFSQISSSVNLNSTAYTLSFYAKSESGSNQTHTVDLGDDVGGNYTVTTSWQRFVFTSLVPINGRFLDFGGVDGNWSLWGVQIQTENAATSYVKPSGGVATTSAARATVGTRFSDYSDLFVAGNAEVDGSAYFAGNVGIGTTSPGNTLHLSGTNGVGMRIENTSNSISAYSTLESNGALQANISGAGVFSWVTGGGEKVRIDNSGRLLVGASSSSGVNATLQVIGDTAAQFHRGTNSASGASIAISKSRNTTYGSNTIVQNDDLIGTVAFRADDGTDYHTTAAFIGCHVDGTPGANDMPGRLTFSTTPSGANSSTERMRIDKDGKIFIGSTGDPATASTNDPKTRLMPGEVSVVNHQGSSLNLNRTGNNGSVAKFFRDGGTLSGKITVTASSTAYETSSDYRLKENVVELADGITRVKQLAPKRFNFIVDADTTVDGFLAHEAQAVVPEAVSGEKDGEEMQGIDQSKLVPLLTAALQEAIAKIETLEQRLTDAGL